jgi:hypothetical protein
LLPDGKVLVAGGATYTNAFATATNSVELYDATTGVWAPTAPMNGARSSHAALLLPSGEVLVVGGLDYTVNGSDILLSSAELFEVGQGYSGAWRPKIASIASPLTLGATALITGLGFRGISEGSGGNNSQDSPSDYPVVQLRSVENVQTLSLRSTGWSSNSILTAPVSGLLPGWTLATVFVNGIPSPSIILRLAPAATRPMLFGPAILPGGAFQFSFTNVSGAAFTALATTDVSLPLTNWTVLGTANEIAAGQFQFTDPQAASFSQRFYSVRSP